MLVVLLCCVAVINLLLSFALWLFFFFSHYAFLSPPPSSSDCSVANDNRSAAASLLCLNPLLPSCHLFSFFFFAFFSDCIFFSSLSQPSFLFPIIVSTAPSFSVPLFLPSLMSSPSLSLFLVVAATQSRGGRR